MDISVREDEDFSLSVMPAVHNEVILIGFSTICCDYTAHFHIRQIGCYYLSLSIIYCQSKSDLNPDLNAQINVAAKRHNDP